MQATKISRSCMQAGDRSFGADYRTLAQDKDTDVSIRPC
jgi:hypothetical protein